MTKFGSSWMSEPHRRVQGESRHQVEGRSGNKDKKSVWEQVNSKQRFLKEGEMVTRTNLSPRGDIFYWQ